MEELLARWFPQPDVRSSVRKLPVPQTIGLLPNPAPGVVSPGVPFEPAPPATAAGAAVVAGDGAPGVSSEAESPPACASVPPRVVVRPLAPERYEIRFTVSAETREKLRFAQDRLGHAIPSGSVAQVFDRALTVLIRDLERKKFAATRRPRRSRGQAEGSRNVPAHVRREVVARDGGRCAFVAVDGRHCGERRYIEFHHVIPYAEPTVENIQLRCRAHNGYEVDLYYGPGRRRTRDTVLREPSPEFGGPSRFGTRPGTSSPQAAEAGSST